MSPEETKKMIVSELKKVAPPPVTELRMALVMALQLLKSNGADAFARAFIEECEALLKRVP